LRKVSAYSFVIKKEESMDETLTMLKDLTDAPGVSGFEEPVRRVMRRYMEQFGEISTDDGKTWSTGYDFHYHRKK